MSGNAATLKLGSDVAGALAGLMGVRMALKKMDADVITSAAISKKAGLVMAAAFGAIGIATVIGLKKASDTFTEFEQTVANAASVTNTTGEEYKKTKDNIIAMSRELGRTTVFSAQAAADALYDLASAGYEVTDMAASKMKPILDLAAGTQNDLRFTTEIVTATLGQFGLTMEDAGRVSDAFALTISTSKADLSKMGLSFKYAGTLAGQFGDSIEGLAAGLALMYNNGLRGEQAGRSLRLAYARLSKPTAEVRAVVKELGLTMDDLSLSGNHMNEVLDLLNSRNITVAQAMRFFGVEAGTGMSAVVKGITVVEQMDNALQGAGGTAAEMAKKQLDTQKNTTELFRSAKADLQILIGGEMSPYIRNITNWMREMVLVISNSVIPAFKKIKELGIKLEPTFNAISVVVVSLLGIFKDLFIDTGMLSWVIDALITTVNFLAVVFAKLIAVIYKYSAVLKLIAMVVAVGILFSGLITIVSALSAAMAFLNLYGFAGIATMIISAVIPAITSLILSLMALSTPIALVAALATLFAVMWATNFGKTREYTDAVIDGIVDSFWWLMDKLFWFVNKSVELGNKLREAAGKEPVTINFDIETAKKGFKRLGTSIKVAKINFMDMGDISIESLSSILEYLGLDVDMVNEVTDAYKKQTDAINANNAALKYGFDIKNLSMEGAKYEISKYRGNIQEATEYGSQAEVNAARASGDINPGDTYIIVDTVNTQGGLENLGDEYVETEESVGP